MATADRAAALAAFNLGIDVAQTAVVLIVIAALWTIGKLPAINMAWVRIPAATMAATVGLAWTVSRLAGVQL